MNLLKVIMEKDMTTNKITIMGSIIIIILIISIPTAYYVVKNYQNNLYRVVEEKIIGAAKKCYYENVCQDEKITLEFLYEKDYLDEISNPVTKEYYNPSSYVLKEDKTFVFYPVE